MHDSSLHEQLVTACHNAGLAVPSTLEALSKIGAGTTHRLRFADGKGAFLLRRLEPTPFCSLLHEATALAVLPKNADIPAVQSHRRLGTINGIEASFFREPPGRWGLDIIRHERAAPQLGRAIGNVMHRLSLVDIDGFGAIADGHWFWPHRDSWASCWEARLLSAAERASRLAHPLGPLLDELVDFVDERRDAVGAITSFHLVHGRINPLAIYVEGETPTGVTRWEAASLGDHLENWSEVLHMGGAILVEVVKGYGAQAVQILLDEGDLVARLEAHAALNLIERAGRLVTDDGAALRSERLVIHARRLLSPNNVKNALATALAGTVRQPSPASSASVMLARSVFMRLAHTPSVGPLDGPPILGTLAFAQLDNLWPDKGLAKSCLRDVSPPRGIFTQAPLGDRQVWRRNLAERLIEGVLDQPQGIHLAAAALWLGLANLDHLDGLVSDLSLRGFESWLASLQQADRQTTNLLARKGKKTQAGHRLIFGILLWAALLELPNRVGVTADLSALTGIVERTVRAAANRLDFTAWILEGYDTSLEPALEVLPQLRLVGQSQLLPAVLLACRVLQDLGHKPIAPSDGFFQLLDVHR
ncbi:MAG: hypothetical protein HN348_22620 [Proteobacteria bacterium]|nr:hypothetical protein [Pseudomonadota bacterium]